MQVLVLKCFIDTDLLLTYDFEALRHRCVGESLGKGHPKVVKGACRGDEYNLVLFQDLKVEHCLEHVGDYVYIELQVMIAQLIVEP